jgi:hypothetical protein
MEHRPELEKGRSQVLLVLIPAIIAVWTLVTVLAVALCAAAAAGDRALPQEAGALSTDRPPARTRAPRGAVRSGGLAVDGGFFAS